MTAIVQVEPGCAAPRQADARNTRYGAARMETKRAIRVFVVDDHELVRRGVVDLIEREPDMEVVGESDSVRHTLGRVLATKPDVVLLDVRLPDGNGIDVSAPMS
ncbi:hypothetical protein GCM10027414_19180 [Humibacter ginsengiterrae]